MAKKRSKKETDHDLKFEDALEQLEQIVADLESGETGLSATLVRYERGVGLLRHCHDLLQQAERRIELLSGVDAEGNPLTTPLDSDSPQPRRESSSSDRGQERSADSPSGRTSGNQLPGGGKSGDSDMDSPETLF